MIPERDPSYHQRFLTQIIFRTPVPNMSLIKVFVAGGTGNVGASCITSWKVCPTDTDASTAGFATVSSLLSYRPKEISSVKFFTRNASSEKAQHLVGQGAEAIEVEGNPAAKDFADADVFVNALPGAPNDTIMKAALEAGVKVYIPSHYASRVPAFVVNFGSKR